MILGFTLSMPRNNSWDGRWSGDGRVFALVRAFVGKRGLAQADKIMAGQPYSYRFGDGWSARIDVRKLTHSEAARLRRTSVGFSGYDWMVRTIVEYGKPMAEREVKAHLEAVKAADALPGVDVAAAIEREGGLV